MARQQFSDKIREAWGYNDALLHEETGYVPEWHRGPDGERQWEPKKVRIRFTPQAWIRDYATEVDPQGPREFEVPVRDAQNEQGEWLPDRSYESDILREHKNAPKWIRQWSGPFEIEILHSQGDAHA